MAPKSLKSHLFVNLVCVCVCVYSSVEVREELQELALSFHHVDSRYGFRTMLGSKCLHLLSHLAGLDRGFPWVLSPQQSEGSGASGRQEALGRSPFLS